MERILLIQLILQSQIIRDHRDKLAICGLSSVVLDCVAKVGIKRIFALFYKVF